MTTVREDLAVVLCTYNGERHVAEQLTSILQQSTLPGEVRVYDDGSRDGTLETVRRTWAARPARAAAVGLHIAPVDGGHGAAQNFWRAMRDAPQPLLALADQDDRWHPSRLERAIRVLDAHPDVDLVASDAAMMDGQGVPVGRTVFEAQRLTRQERAAFDRHEYLPALLRRNLVPGMTFTLRRSLVGLLGALPEGAMHDYWLVTAAAARDALRLDVAALVAYRIHSGNAVGLDPGSRSVPARIRVKVRALREPLTDLPQWLELPDRLAQDVRVQPDVLADLLGKRRFEIARRFSSTGLPRRAASALQLVRGGTWDAYEFRGAVGVVRDLLRRRDARTGSGDQPPVQ